MTADGTVTQAPAPASSEQRLDDLSQIILAYNQVTERLQKSHEALQDQVVRLREQLARADAQLQRSRRLAALGQMAAGIAHEIRNPLAAIQLYAGSLTEDLGRLRDLARESEAAEVGEDGPTVAGVLDGNVRVAGKIAEAVRGLNGIVGDVLTFARDMRPASRETGAMELMSRAVEGHQPAIDAAGVEVRLEAEEGTTVLADADLMQQALLNLVRNAVDAMAQAGGTGRRVLTLRCRRSGEAAWIRVSDTGPGIAEGDMERIFNPFFTTRATGTGLGLAIVHRIIDAHGGSVRVWNEGGAVFELAWPQTSAKAAGGGVRSGSEAERMTSGDGVAVGRSELSTARRTSLRVKGGGRASVRSAA